MIDATRLEDARKFCFEIAPELQGSPLYLVNDPASLPKPETTLAYAVIGRHILLREHLMERGEWRGPGPMIVFVFDDRPDRRDFFALVAHELAHCVPYIPLPEIEPTSEQRELQASFLAAWSEAEPVDPAVPWLGHGLGFIRRVLHLHYRALWAGVPIPLPWLNCAGVARGLSPAWQYLEALGSEPFRLRSATFEQIEQTKLPGEFVALWESDMREWSQRHPKQKQFRECSQ